MNYNQHFNRTLLLAGPVVMSQLGHIMVNVADSVMVGQVGTIPLAAAALAGSIYHAAQLFGIGISYGATPLVAAAYGGGKLDVLKKVFKHSWYINLVVGLLLAAIVAGGAPLLVYFGQDPAVVEQAIPYLQITGFSVFWLMIFQHFRQYMEGLTSTRPAMVVSIISNLINVGLNYVLIFGKLGFEPMGLLGAGIATLIARVIMAGMMAGYFLLVGKYRQYWQDFRHVNYDPQEVKRVFRIGAPSGAQLMFEVSAFSFSSVMAGWIGAKALAAHQIALNVSGVTYMMATGISAASTIRVGNFFGKQEYADLRKAGVTSFLIVTGFMAIWCTLFILGNQFFPGLYVDDPEVIRLAAPIFIVVAFYQISDGIQVVGLGALRGISDVKIPTLVTLLAYWVCAIPLAYGIAFLFGVGLMGIWIGLLIGLTIAGLLHVWRFIHLSNEWRMKM